MKNKHHRELLEEIIERAGKARPDSFLNGYLGNSHPIYALRAPALRDIASSWMRSNRDLDKKTFVDLLTSLAEGESATEKMLVGILLDYAGKDLRAIHPKHFVTWLNHLEGWAEVDALCTNKSTAKQIPLDWKTWEPYLRKLSTAKRIEKRRASLALLVSAIRKTGDKELLEVGIENIEHLKHEKHVLITKAVSWLLRSAIKRHRADIEAYVQANKSTLPAIAVRETLKVLDTGKKTG